MELRILEFEGDGVIVPFTKKVYTIEDIEALPEGKRAELINGKIYMLASPATVHQELLGELSYAIHTYIKQKKGPCLRGYSRKSVGSVKGEGNYRCMLLVG